MQNNQQHTNMEKLNLTVFPSILTALQELLTASLKKKKNNCQKTLRKLLLAGFRAQTYHFVTNYLACF